MIATSILGLAIAYDSFLGSSSVGKHPTIIQTVCRNTQWMTRVPRGPKTMAKTRQTHVGGAANDPKQS